MKEVDTPNVEWCDLKLLTYKVIDCMGQKEHTMSIFLVMRIISVSKDRVSICFPCLLPAQKKTCDVIKYSFDVSRFPTPFGSTTNHQNFIFTPHLVNPDLHFFKSFKMFSFRSFLIYCLRLNETRY